MEEVKSNDGIIYRYSDLHGDNPSAVEIRPDGKIKKIPVGLVERDGEMKPNMVLITLISTIEKIKKGYDLADSSGRGKGERIKGKYCVSLVKEYKEILDRNRIGLSQLINKKLEEYINENRLT